MSFGAMTAWQALLLIAGAAAAAVWLFRMKIRPPRVQVPTLLLWRRVFDQVRELEEELRARDSGEASHQAPLARLTRLK